MNCLILQQDPWFSCATVANAVLLCEQICIHESEEMQENGHLPQILNDISLGRSLLHYSYLVWRLWQVHLSFPPFFLAPQRVLVPRAEPALIVTGFFYLPLFLILILNSWECVQNTEGAVLGEESGSALPSFRAAPPPTSGNLGQHSSWHSTHRSCSWKWGEPMP